MTPIQQAALDRLIALMEADPGTDRLLVPVVEQDVLDRRAAGWELVRAQRTVQADLLDRPDLVDHDLITGPLRDRLLRWLPTTGVMLSKQRAAAWDDVGARSSLAEVERVLVEEGLTKTVERWEYDNGDVSVVVLDPEDGVLAEVSTSRQTGTRRYGGIHVSLYCNFIAHDVQLWMARAGGNVAEIRDSLGPTGVFVVDVSGVYGLRVPLVAMRAFGEFVRPWRQAAIKTWLGGDSAVIREQALRPNDNPDDHERMLEMLERLTKMRVAMWPSEVHDLLGPIYANRSLA